jgi:hypothetical protein
MDVLAAMTKPKALRSAGLLAKFLKILPKLGAHLIRKKKNL